MNDSITIKQVVELLRADGTLKGYFGPDECMEQTFTHLSYSSADVQPNTFSASRRSICWMLPQRVQEPISLSSSTKRLCPACWSAIFAVR